MKRICETYYTLSPVLDCQINLMGLLNILECCRKFHVLHVIFSSSAAVYGDNTNIPLKETEPLQPMSPYGITKMASENYLRVYHDLYGLDVTIFRFANVYGQRQGEKGEGGVISIFCRQIGQGKGITIFGDGTQTRDFVYAGDIARAVEAALPLKGFHIMNISTGEETSLNRLLTYFSQAAGQKIAVKYEQPRKGDILRSVLDNHRMKEILHIKPEMGLQEGIEKSYKWYWKNKIRSEKM